MSGMIASIPTSRQMIGQNGPLRKVTDVNSCFETIRAGMRSIAAEQKQSSVMTDGEAAQGSRGPDGSLRPDTRSSYMCMAIERVHGSGGGGGGQHAARRRAAARRRCRVQGDGGRRPWAGRPCGARAGGRH